MQTNLFTNGSETCLKFAKKPISDELKCNHEKHTYISYTKSTFITKETDLSNN